MTVKAYVLKTEDDNAMIVIRRKSACATCTTGCVGCSKSREHRAVALNKAKAKVGDIVNVYYPDITLATFIIYMIPIILAVLIYFATLSMGTDYASVLSFISLIAGFISLYIVVGRVMYKFKKLEITEVLFSDLDQ